MGNEGLSTPPGPSLLSTGHSTNVLWVSCLTEVNDVSMVFLVF